jgi:hypothetical protein
MTKGLRPFLRSLLFAALALGCASKRAMQDSEGFSQERQGCFENNRESDRSSDMPGRSVASPSGTCDHRFGDIREMDLTWPAHGKAA